MRNRSRSIDFSKVNAQLDAMDDRVRRLIARQKPLKLDASSRPRPKPLPKVKRPAHDYVPAPIPHRWVTREELRKEYPAVGSGELTGNEMPWPEYEPPGCSQDERKGFDFMRDVIFAEFNQAVGNLGRSHR